MDQALIGRLRGLAILLLFLVITLPLMPLQWLFLKFNLSSAQTFPHRFHKWVCWLLGVKVTVIGEKPTGAALIVSNHVSWLDIPVLSAVHPLSFIAKKDVRGWPFFGALARLQNSVFVNREARHSTGASRNEIAERLRRGHALVLFAEGTSGTGKDVRPFKSSFFAAVAGTTAPVVPLTLVYHGIHGLPLTVRQRPSVAWYGDMDMMPHLWRAITNGPLTVKVILHPPLETALSGNRKALSAAAEIIIKSSLAETLHGGVKIG